MIDMIDVKASVVPMMRDLQEIEILSVCGGADSGPSTATGCYYAGQFYSPGSVVTMDGRQYQCSRKFSGEGYEWRPM